MPRLTKVDWAAVQRAYVAAEETVTALAERLGTTASAVRSRASRNGWKRSTGSRRTKALPEHDRHAHLAERQRLARRLTKAIDRILAKMEKRMASEKKDAEPTTAADQERDSRMVHSLIRSLEKVTEFEADLERPDDAGHDAADARAFADEAERARSEIAERLARLGSAPSG